MQNKNHVRLLVIILLALVIITVGWYFLSNKSSVDPGAEASKVSDTSSNAGSVETQIPNEAGMAATGHEEIIIKYPTGGEKFTAGDVVTVLFDAPSTLKEVEIAIIGQCDQTIDPNCFKTSGEGYYKSFGAVNTGEYTLKIPPNVGTGQYSIIVADFIGMGSNYSTKTENFSIFSSDKVIFPEILVSTPSKGTLIKDDTVDFEWEIKNPANFELSYPNVNIQILASTCSWEKDAYAAGCSSFGDGVFSVSSTDGKYTWQVSKEKGGFTQAIPGKVYNVKAVVSAEFKELGRYFGNTEFRLQFDQ
jgi:hypothetical protein